MVVYVIMNTCIHIPPVDLYIQPIRLEHMSNYIRVVSTELHPRIQYKTLPITEYTTAYEVVVKLVTKFATKDKDKDPDLFYLTEVNSITFMLFWQQ